MMKCEKCGRDVKSFMILPLHRESGELDPIFCTNCAIESSAYCKKHQLIHQGFGDGTTACITCVEDKVLTFRHQASGIFNDIQSVLSYGVLREAGLIERLDISAKLMRSNHSIALLRFIASKAQREGVPIQTIVKRIKEERSVDCILS